MSKSSREFYRRQTDCQHSTELWCVPCGKQVGSETGCRTCGDGAVPARRCIDCGSIDVSKAQGGE